MVNFFRNAVSISSITLVSRILGMIRDALIAFVFGASMMTDAFFIAFRPFDLARKMVSEGMLSVSLVPLFSAYIAKGRKDQAVSMFLSACFLFSVFSVVIVLLGVYFAPFIINFLAPGFAENSYAHTLSSLLLKIMLPYLVTILGVALSMGILNSLGNFHIPAATPILLNLSIIGGALFFADLFSPKVLVLGAGVTLGGLAQLALQLPYLARSGMMDFQQFTLIHPGLVKALKRMLPSMVGAGAFQVNMLIAGVFATQLVPGSVSYLYYAERLVQFPLALFATSAATVFLPLLSGRAASQNLDGVRPAFETGVRLVFFLTIPAMAGIMALNRPIVALLFGRGQFDGASVLETGDCLFFLVSGLWAMAGTRLFVTFHYALSNIRLPFIAGLITIGANVVLAGVLIRFMGVAGLALSVSLSSIIGFLFLAGCSPSAFGLGPLFVSACRALFISGIMGFAVRWIWTFWVPATGVVQAMGLMATIAAGAGTYFVAAMFLANSEMALLKKVFFKKNDHG